MRDAVSRFRADDRGATAIEYGLIAAGVALAIAGAVVILGEDVGGVFGRVSDAVSPADTEPSRPQQEVPQSRRPGPDRGNEVDL